MARTSSRSGSSARGGLWAFLSASGWQWLLRFALLAAVVAASWVSGDLLFLARYA